MERYSAQELAAAARVPRSTLDYWTRVGLLAPTLPGSHYSAREMAVGLLLAEASRLGATAAILAAVVEKLDGDPWSWPQHLWVTSRGAVLEEDTAPAAWVLHPRRVLAASGPLMLLALAS